MGRSIATIRWQVGVSMKRELLIARGLVATGLWILGAGTAEATTYDYGVGLLESATASATSYFLNSSQFSFTPLTPGAFSTSARGTVYSGSPSPISATPEPPSALLVLSGLLGLLAPGRKGAPSARRRVGEGFP